ncbi:Hypothetical predicted protein [Mytilus galloprovincialis]|uniref:RNase H type-1 domain-containing protein n=1 Tax=Mytilus galloprovincialis TaxID=29158 RepID=A0A8B6H5E2_MYTGA|nr:Hypothetical predicted protein [Mytilus galloprovincialis]
MEKQEDKFKKCVRCPDRTNTLDEHDECYKHRICNESFPCKICKNWSKEHRSLIMKMIEKSVQKTIKLNKLSQPVCVDGLTDFKDISPPVEAAVGASNDDTVTENTPDNSTCMVDISAIVQEQVQLQIQNLFKKKLIDINANVLEVQPPEKPSSKKRLMGLHRHDLVKCIHAPQWKYHKGHLVLLIQLSGFLLLIKWQLVLNIEPEASETHQERPSFVSARLKPDKNDKKSAIKLPLEGTIIDMVKSVEKEAISGHLKNRAVRGRDDKAFMVKKDDFNAFCSPPKLDDNIEEGLPIGHKGNSFKSGVNIPPFHRELDNDFSSYGQFCQGHFLEPVSYGTMISAFLDEATCEDDRIEGRKALINCFRSMADLSGRIMANSVLSRRKLFLKNVNFISKSTEKKLLKLPVFGSQLFNGKYFDTLHTSAENLRDARETQNVYNNTGSYSKNFNKSRDDRTPVNDFNRKRKGDYSENSESGAKVARTNTYSNKDNFRPGNFSRKGNFFFGKQLGAQRVSSSKEIKFKQKNLVQTVKILSPQEPTIQLTLITDASELGWGAHLGTWQTSGIWPKSYQLKHINWLELKAVQLALQEAVQIVKDMNILIRSDNTTVISYINKQGGTHSPELCYLTWDLYQWCIQNKVTIRAVHIPGKINLLADALSRGKNLFKMTEWTLNNMIVNMIFQRLGTPSIDLFATAQNKKLAVYCSPVPDIDIAAFQVDALTLTEFEYNPEQEIEEDDQFVTMRAYFTPLVIETMTKDLKESVGNLRVR